MKIVLLVLTLLLMLPVVGVAVLPASAADKVYQYYPEKVELTGMLVKKMFYGPPGYGEDPKHDKKEQVFILKLDRPIKVVAQSSDYTSHDNVREIQISKIQGAALEQLLKKKVRIKGSLYSASIGHDHTDVLIDADEAVPDKAVGATGELSPSDVVRQLYEDFSRDGSDSVHTQKREVLLKYFDRKLVDLFIKDQKCQEREQGICRLDFMVQYAAQDDQITDLQIGVFDASRKSLSVTFNNFGKPETLVYHVSKTSSGWRISDIRYHRGPSLVELLSGD